MRGRPLVLRAGLLIYVLGITTLALIILPASSFYAAILTTPTSTSTSIPVTEFCPILGETSCQPFRENVNSVAIRWVLYQEAVAMFANNPLFGVGSTRFGECSCTGPGGYPHSTILQAFAELGLIGGGALAALLGLAAATLVRPFLSALQETDGSVRAFVMALFSVFLVADQISGNYFMSVGMWLILGMAASMRAHDRQEASHG
jgi:O-antigen ligase